MAKILDKFIQAVTAAQAKFSAAQAELTKDLANEDAKKAFNEAVAELTKAQTDLAAAADKLEPTDDQLSKVRKEEKTKLYDKLKESEKKVKEMAEKMIAMAKVPEPKDGEELVLPGDKNEADDKAKAKEDDKSKEPILDPRTIELEKQLAIQASEMANLKKSLALQELEAYKREQLAKAGDTLIPELVSGTNKEEIDNSIKKSQEIYQRTAKKIGAPGAAGGNTNHGLPTPPAPSVNPKLLTGEISREAIAKMPPAEWAKERAKFGFK